MKSIIYANEKIENLEKYKTANAHYYPALMILDNGKIKPLLFTHHELTVAINRGIKNPEDFKAILDKEKAVAKKKWWQFGR